jgi:copper chaperone CopZ
MCVDDVTTAVYSLPGSVAVSVHAVTSTLRNTLRYALRNV